MIVIIIMMKMAILGKESREENCGSQLLKGQFNGFKIEGRTGLSYAYSGSNL